MSFARPFPPQPDIDQYKTGAGPDAELSIACEHGFSNWDEFAYHVKALGRSDSPVSRFETAVNAIVSGDAATLSKLLAEDPALVRMRSNLDHHSTLLHYVSANGVEDFRQKTPANIVEIANLLLDAGADVNAESDAYRGHCTTLLLTATSIHPEKAGVQLALMDLLLERGATFGEKDIRDCLANGRGQAAEFLANRGAPLDIEGAAGVGRLDEAQRLAARATQQQLNDSFAWACQFGRIAIVEYLLDFGVAVNTKREQHGETGLHWAAYAGHAEILRLLLSRGALVDVKDDTYQGTPLDWALHGSKNSEDKTRYGEVIEILERAGPAT